ncbi:MAG TPA: bacillithiol biosynthesis cysteine-adding enzyme BshC [Polyangia bacterium]|nr:bacillithiol biosynthesis cysteine-adding enzyme BshC [Polyangia bacterium]
MGRTFSSSYLAGEPAARAFLTRDFRDPAARREATRASASRRTSPALLRVLAAQQAGLPPSAARDANLAALGGGQTVVVATGQQVGLFLGPLYSFYKAATAIVAARALEAETGVRTVPLFWLQTEDHDFAEIAACRVAVDDGAPLTLALAPEDAAMERVSLAHRRLGPEIAALVETLAAALGPGEASAEVVALLGAHYAPGQSPAAAFAGVLATIFADEGLLILDPRVAPVAALAAPLYRRALDDATALEARLRARGAALAAAGLDEQIPVRPGCALLFFHQRDAAGRRFRLQREDGRWTLAGAGETIEDAELRGFLDQDPLRLSTSALMRPIVQDALLPTAAYVGGPAEISYFAQLEAIYDIFGLPPPLVIPRARFRVLDAPTRRRLEQLGLSSDDATRPRAELLARLGAGAAVAGPDPDALRRLVSERITPAVADLTRAALAADARLDRPAARTRAGVERALERFIARYARTRSERDEVVTARLDKLQRALVPEGVPQERYYGWPSLAARVGPATLKRLVLERLAGDPFPTTLQELRP